MITSTDVKLIMNTFFKHLKVSNFNIFMKFKIYNWVLFFAEPTQIYRYLATRNMVSPVFLNRTLTFMKKRMSRASSEKVRHSFKVDSLLKRKESDNKSAENSNLERYLNLTLLGYCDKKRMYHKKQQFRYFFYNNIIHIFLQFQHRNH